MKEDTLMTQPSLDSLESPNHQELMQRFESSVLVFTQIYSTTIVTGYGRNHGQVRDQLYNIYTFVTVHDKVCKNIPKH